MIFDVCLFKFCTGKLSQYPSLDYVKDVIRESRKLTFPLHGKRQLCLVKRGISGNVFLYNIYNYVYNDKNDSIGICIVFHDKYPYDIDFLFKFYGLIIAEIIEEGKALFFDSKGNIICDNNDLEFHHSTLSKHKDKIKETLQSVKTKVRAIPRNVYNSFEDQHIVCQLSDKSWSLDDIFKTNNVVVITEEIEEENINSMRSFILKSNATVHDLNKKIKTLEEQLKRAEKEKKKYSQTLAPKKQDNNTTGNEKSKALNDDKSNKRKYEILGCSGAVAIYLFTVFAIYGLSGGFSTYTAGEGGNIQTVPEKTIVLESESEHGRRNDLLDEELRMIKDEKAKEDVPNDTFVETIPLHNDSINNEIDAPKKVPVVASSTEKKIIAPRPVAKPIAKPMTKKEKFNNAKRNKDWNSMKQLADAGYTPAYLPLAEHYMNNPKQHRLAKKYAEKAKRSGVPGATRILKELEDLDY